MAFPAVTYTDNQNAFAGLFSNSAAAGLSLQNLSPMAALASVCANLLVDDPSTVSVPAGDVRSGAFGANIPDTGIYSFPAQLGVGTTGLVRNGLRVGGSATATAGQVQSAVLFTTLVAAANNNAIYGLQVIPTVTPGAFTGLVTRGISIAAFSTATYTSPGDPLGLEIGAITGTGATNATAISIAPPTGASNNYLIAHTTAATFNVTASGVITTAGGMTVSAGGIGMTAASGNTIAIGGTPNASVGLNVATGTTLTGTSQYNIGATTAFSSAATTAGYGINIQIQTAAAAFTMTNAYGIFIATPNKGAGSAITNVYGTYWDAQSGGATNNYVWYAATTTNASSLTQAGLLTVGGSITTVGAITAQNATAIPAGGTAGSGYLFSSTANFGVFFGSGAPSLSAAKGSLYLRSDGSGVGDRAYINTNGSTTWTALTTVG